MEKGLNSPLEQFLLARHADIGRIRAINRMVDVEEIVNQAWLLAQDIGGERGAPIDYSSARDQELLIQALKDFFLGSETWHHHYAISLDHWTNKDGEDEGASPLLIKLSEDRSLDPPTLLEVLEEESPEKPEQGFDYSEASAYVALLERCDHDFPAMAKYLRLSVQSCRCRCDRACLAARRQWPVPLNPLFHFIPNPWRIRPGVPIQCFFAFETQLDFSFVVD